MIQGTSSNAGKSLLTTALCRLMARRGFKVAPFKAQNMALNSHVTADGHEMGRAQALQALACGLEPDVRMNPILLKPTSQTGSQVIVLGQPVGRMKIQEYLRYKPKAWRAVRRAYAELAADKDIMLLEGAGSPAEINLRAHDIVNMRMARHANARVLLVSDIDRGGAFAALAGTMTLLGRRDRSLVAGYVLNKFRGDISLLAPALETVRQRTHRPFFGVIPMLEGLRLPEEDSVSFKQNTLPGMVRGPLVATDSLDIALIDLPHISNFTDVDALRMEPDLKVRIVGCAEDLGQPDMLIVPGSKNTIADMAFLRRTGLAEALSSYAARCLTVRKGMLVGICGGLQMMGMSIVDPLDMEAGGFGMGLGLLRLETEMVEQKRLCRVEGRSLPCLTGQEHMLCGYEIHHGRTCSLAGSPATTICIYDTAGQELGWGHTGPDGMMRIWGSYLHGLFDTDAFRHALLARLRQEAGLPARTGVSFSLGPELDRLADAVEAALDMKAIEDLFIL